MLKISFSHTLSQLQSSMASPCRIGDILLPLLFPSSTGRTANLLALAPLPKSFEPEFPTDDCSFIINLVTRLITNTWRAP